MAEAVFCPHCGTELNETGLCPACLLKLGMSGAVPKLAEEPPVLKPAKARRPRWIVISAAVAAIALVAAGFALLRTGNRPPAGPVVRFTLPLSDDGEFALSPDGTKLVYTKDRMLWVRRLDALEGQALAGTEGAESPFWSPDSQVAGFFALGKLKRIALSGGPPQTVCDAPGGPDGMWSTDGSILYTAAGLFRVSASGGMPQMLRREQEIPRSPVMLPDNRSFLYSLTGSSPDSGIYAGTLNSGNTKLLLRGVVSPVLYSQGYVLFLREGVLLAQQFDVHRLELRGDARPVRFAEHVDQFSVSENGVLAYRSGATRATQLMWFDRMGKGLGTAGEPGEQQRFAISPDGMRAIVAPGLWMLDFALGAKMRLAFDPLAADGPVWSPDGSKIAFSARDAGPGAMEFGLYIAPANGAGTPEPLFKSRERMSVDSWSSDGKFILYTSRDPGRPNSLWSLSLEKGSMPLPVVKNNFNNWDGQFSPDARWIAYVSDESQRQEVYVQPFPGPAGKWQISASGGSRPVWRRDGKELFFVTPERLVMSVAIESSSAGFRADAPRPLFKLPGRGWYTTTDDGKRFLASAPLEREPAALNLVLNWTVEVGQVYDLPFSKPND